MREDQGASLIGRLLVEADRLDRDALARAERLRKKLDPPRPLIDVLIARFGISRDDIHGVIAANRGAFQLGQLLVELGHLREEDLEQALAIQREQPDEKRRIGEILVSHHFLEETKLAEVLSAHLGFEFVDPGLSGVEPSLREKLPLRWCEEHGFVPVRREGERVVVAFVDPLDTRALEAAESVFGQDRVVPALALRSSIDSALAGLGHRTGPETNVGEEATVEAVEQLLHAAIERAASDIHIEPREDRVSVRFREDGVMVPYRDFPLSFRDSLANRIKVMCGANIAERRRHQDGRIRFVRDDRELDLRISIYVTVHGEKIVIRLLNHDRALVALDGIGMSPRTLSRFREDALECPSGVVLVTGPTGSGKTTTLYACLDAIKDDATSIITAEDPVEYIIDGIAQCSLNPAIQLTYEETLRHIVRQDPDVIVIGEIRDEFSAETAIQAALTGHKVLTTFHTEDTIGGLLRLLNMDIEAFLVSSTVVSVMAQRLLRRVCSECAEPYTANASQLRRLGYAPGALDDATLMRGRGCSTCRGSGYKGRVCIFELLVLDENVRDAILNRKTSFEIRRIARDSSNLVSLFEDGVAKAADGLTTIDEVLRMLPKLADARPLGEIRRRLGI